MNSCILITSHLNNLDKLKVASNLLDILNKLNLPIIFAGNFPISTEIQEKTNYTIFHNYNPKTCSIRNMYFNGKVIIDYGYAHLSQILTGFKFCNNLGFDYVHHFNYDAILEEGEYERLIEKSKDGEFLYYPWGNDGISTSLFSIKTKTLIDALEPNIEYYYNENPPGIRNNWFCEVFFEWVFLYTGLYESLNNFCDIRHRLLVSS
jgi:hypothetical protein